MNEPQPLSLDRTPGVSLATVANRIEQLKNLNGAELRENPFARETFNSFRQYLNLGQARSAERDEEGNWHAVSWVKEGILVGMRLGLTVDVSKPGETLRFSDKDTLPLREIDIKDNIRVVPGGTTIRDGAYISPGVIIMPPAYVNIGAYIDSGTMIDSHALVGSCGQVGKDCHISAGAQIGGVLEPVGANPCIVEDNVVMGINSSIAEGVILGEGAVLTPGVNITASTPVYDLVRGEIYTATPEKPLRVPNLAMVVMGTRPKTDSDFAVQHGLQIATPMIVKYRDMQTDLKLQLEQALR